MKAQDLIEEQKSLVEELGVYFHNLEDMSPLSARIFSLLILIGEEGTCFDELVENLGASKSSISVNLNLLQTKGVIRYFTRTGDRKRYFIISEDYIINRLESKIKEWKAEKALHERILSFKLKKVDPQIDRIKFNENYIQLINDVISNFENLKKSYISNTLKENNEKYN